MLHKEYPMDFLSISSPDFGPSRRRPPIINDELIPLLQTEYLCTYHTKNNECTWLKPIPQPAQNQLFTIFVFVTDWLVSRLSFLSTQLTPPSPLFQPPASPFILSSLHPSSFTLLHSFALWSVWSVSDLGFVLEACRRQLRKSTH